MTLTEVCIRIIQKLEKKWSTDKMLSLIVLHGI